MEDKFKSKLGGKLGGKIASKEKAPAELPKETLPVKKPKLGLGKPASALFKPKAIESKQNDKFK